VAYRGIAALKKEHQLKNMVGIRNDELWAFYEQGASILEENNPEGSNL
jgi:hypothetical protein